ncbi:MAG: NAD-dependent succinate-semialdehyde dehydrogenase [Actinomycetota bacterium]
MPYLSTNPATGEVVATFQDHTEAEVEARVAQAASTFEHYRLTSFSDRAMWMRTAAEILEGELPNIAQVLTEEMGKTFNAAKGEVLKCAMTMRYYAEHAEQMLSEQSIPTSASRSGVRYDPIGVVLAVMPWNFPLWQVVRFAAPALMAGNVGMLKHASNVPKAALLLEDAFRRAGFPDGCFTNLFLPARRVAALIADDRIAAVTLTGSEAAGQSVGAAAGHALKKCVLELGGSDPFIVCSSADLDRAVPMAVTGRVQNNGQSCIAAKRFLVMGDRYDEFLQRFSAEMDALVVGDPMDPATTVGPLVSEQQRDEIAQQVADAVAKGATLNAGGFAPEGPGFFYRPTVLTNVTPDMRAGCEELFGPVAVVERVKTLEEAIAIANNTPWGLGASVWANDPTEQEACIRGIEAGMVFVNAIVASTPELPFGGMKRSGYGRELSELGIREFCNVKTIFVA